MEYTVSDLPVNTLVRHKKYRGMGIGCVSKQLKASVKVNFGTEDVMTVKPSMLELVDVSKCKTMKMHQLRVKMLNNKLNTNVIIGNEVKHYVGIGLISQGVVTEDDLKKYPRIVD